jgi:predicted outer membrane lipoprotein
MLIRRTSHWILGTAMATAVAHFTTMAQTLVEAFEPDLESWETLPVVPATEHSRLGLYQHA